MKISTALKDMRKELSVMQADFAAALHVNLATVSRWENGRNIPNPSMAVMIMNFAKEKGASAICLENLEEALTESREIGSSNAMNTVDYTTVNQLINDSSNGVCVCDAQSYELLYVNSTAANMVNLKVEDAKGKACYEFLMNAVEPCNFCPMRELENDSFRDTTFISPNTGKHYFIRGKLMEWQGHKAHVEYITDVTVENDTTENILHMTNGLPCGVGVYNIYPDNRVELVYMNDGFYKLIGTTRQERKDFSGFNTFDSVLEEDREKLTEELRRASLEKCVGDIDIRILCPNGEYKWFNVKANVAYRGFGKTAMYVAFSDIDNQKKLQLRLTENYRAMELAAKKDAISSAKINLSTDMVEEFYSKYFDANINAPISMEDLLGKGVGNDIYEEDFPKVEKLLNLSAMRSRYEEGISSDIIEYRRKIPGKGIRWVRGTLAIIKDPESLDSVAFYTVIDIDIEKKNDIAIQGILNEEIEGVILYLPIVNQVRILMENRKWSHKVNVTFPHDEAFEQELLSDVVEADKASCKEFICTTSIVDRLNECSVLWYTYRVTDENGNERRKKLRAFFLDDSKGEVVFVL